MQECLTPRLLDAGYYVNSVIGTMSSIISNIPHASNEDDSALRPLRLIALGFLGYFLATLLLYSKTLDDYLLYDDVGILQHFDPARGFRLVDFLLPMENGFLRPLNLLSFKLLWSVFGTTPWPYHIFGIAIHAAVATASAYAFRVVAGGTLLQSAVIGLAVTVASAAFPTVYMFSNSCDSYMALGSLVLVIQWTLWLRHQHIRNLLLSAVALVFALAGKETAIATAVFIALQTWVSRSRKPAHVVSAIAFIFACAAYAALMYYLQRRTAASYTNVGLADMDPALYLQRFRNFFPATLFPGTFVMEPLWSLPAHQFLSSALGWLFLVLTGVALVIVILRLTKSLHQQAAIWFLTAAALLFPVLALGLADFRVQQQPSARFIYASIPYVIMAVGTIILTLRRGRLPWAMAILTVTIWMSLQVVIIRKSPGPWEFQQVSKEWENLVKELGRVRAEWEPALNFVVIYSGQEYGSVRLPENYGMTLFRVYYPDMLANYYSNRVPPMANQAYVFNGRKLLPASFARQ